MTPEYLDYTFTTHTSLRSYSLDSPFNVIFQVLNIQILKQFGAERLLEIMSEVPENLK